MLNPKTVQIAQAIAEVIPHLVIDRESNVITLEDGEGERFLVTVESMFHVDTVPIPLPI